jgi:uncharacterized protein (DUF302 family)
MKHLIALIIVLASTAGCATGKQAMFKEFVSPYGFDETIERVSSQAKKEGWKVPGVGKIHENLAKAGKQIAPVAVINLCNPDHAERLLRADADRVVSALLPCRVSVYETADGVRLSMLHPDFLAAHLDGVPGEVVPKAAAENAGIVARALGSE